MLCDFFVCFVFSFYTMPLCVGWVGGGTGGGGSLLVENYLPLVLALNCMGACLQMFLFGALPNCEECFIFSHTLIASDT